MEIRGIGGVNPLEQPGKGKPLKASPAEIKMQDDSLSVSGEAAILKDEVFLKEIIAKTTAIDESRVSEVKERLASGYYDRKDVIDALADKMIKVLGL